MHEIHFPMSSFPKINVADYTTEMAEVYHPDRLLRCHVLLYVTQGMFSIEEDGVEYSVEAGDLFFMHAGVHHKGVHKSSGNRKWYYIHFFPEVCFENVYTVRTRPVVRELEYGVSDYHYDMVLPKMIHDGGKRLERNISEIVSVFASHDPLCNVKSSCLFYRFLLENSITQQELFRPRYSPHVESLVHFLEENYSGVIDAVSLEKKFRLNYRYLSTLFRKETGTTVHSFLCRVRVNKACHLLRYAPLNISEVGTAVGYPDPVHFSHVFKSVMGVSPQNFMSLYKQSISYNSEELN